MTSTDKTEPKATGWADMAERGHPSSWYLPLKDKKPRDYSHLDDKEAEAILKELGIEDE